MSYDNCVVQNVQQRSATFPMQIMHDTAASGTNANPAIPRDDVPEHIRDADSMSEAALKKKYKYEFNSWRSRRREAL